MVRVEGLEPPRLAALEPKSKDNPMSSVTKPKSFAGHKSNETRKCETQILRLRQRKTVERAAIHNDGIQFNFVNYLYHNLPLRSTGIGGGV